LKKLVIAAVWVLSAVNARAADLPVRTYVKAPIAKTAAVYDWTGFYAGVNLGLAVGGEGRSGLDVPGLGGAFETFNLASLGAVGGGQAGYNYQSGNWVIGAEADIQGIGNENHANCILTCNAATGAVISQDLTWFGTVRGRVGYASGPILNYFTAGFAYGGVKTNLTERLLGTPGAFSADTIKTGYVLGSGIEAALGGNWTAKIEYLYVDLGSTTSSFTGAGVPQILGTEVRESIFRAGVNYRLGGNGGMLALTPAANWTGFYAGGNGGSGIARDATTHTVAVVPTLNNSFDLAPRGYNGGLQAGYNWQQGNIVYGVETDIQYSTQETDRSCLITCTSTTSAAFRQKLDWFGTARGRIGYGVGPTLFYATGGLAYGEVKTRVTENIALSGISDTTNFKDVRAGWALGAGVETPLELFDWFKPGQWSVKTEYLYIDLGSASNSYNLNGVAHTLTTEETNHIFRTGVNYHFDTPVTAKF
jgi:outer membrane immunogenic protein